LNHGLNFFTNAVDKTPAAGSWQTVDVSANGVPAGASGVILDIHNTHGSTIYKADVRKKGSSDDDYANGKIAATNAGPSHKYAMVGIDGNRQFEAYIENATYIKIWLVGYTGDGVVYFLNKKGYQMGTTITWVDINPSADVPAGATGVIMKIINTATASYKGSVRKNGSSDDDNATSNILANASIWAMCGVDADRLLEGYIGNTLVDHYLVGYFSSTSKVIFKTNWVDKTLAGTGWQDLDLTADTSAIADGAIFRLRQGAGAARDEIRKKGSGDDRNASAVIASTCHVWALTGLDADQVCQTYCSDMTFAKFYLMAYHDPVVVPTVTTQAASGLELD
jgi:hypothetical protein